MSNGRDACQMLQESHGSIELCLVSSSLHGSVSSLELLRTISQQYGIPLVLLLGYAEAKGLGEDECADLKLAGCLQRPIDPRALRITLYNALRAEKLEPRPRAADFGPEQVEARAQAVGAAAGEGATTGPGGDAADCVSVTERYASLGRVAGAVAHDLKSLLQAVKSGSSALLDSRAEGDCRRLLVEVQHAAARASVLVHGLLASQPRAARGDRGIAVDEVLDAMRFELERALGEGTQMSMQLDAAECPVRIDPISLEQLIRNLIANARDAMPGGGHVTVRTRVVERPSPSAGASCWMELVVEDTGTGMPGELRQRIFEPFFTTKGSRGTGLGLTTVYNTVRQCSGTVDVESTPGEGTTFRIVLPGEGATSSLVPLLPQSVQPTNRTRRRALVLVIDDEPLVREMAARVVEDLGHEVLVAAGGEQALVLVESRGAAIDLVLTDIVMSGLNGFEVVEQCFERFPQARALFMTGYTEGFVREAYGSSLERFARRLDLLEKPFDVPSLVNKLDALIEA
ncbi:MAG: ATP-binding protein [Myxococcales bacterium]|nr:ATP-binding protein [Myxococcales bacterium]